MGGGIKEKYEKGSVGVIEVKGRGMEKGSGAGGRGWRERRSMCGGE